MKKKVLIVIGIVFLAFLTWRVVGLISKKSMTTVKRPARPPVAVMIDNVTYAPIKEIREFTGTVYPIYQYVVAPKVSGRIIKIRKRIGDPVSRGEVIARIDDAEYQQAVLEGEANLKIAQATLTESKGQAELAKQELDRAKSLNEKGIASPSELDAAVTNNTALESRLKLAMAQVDQRKASLNSAKIRLSYTVLNATEPGFIGERFADEGALLAPNSPVVTVLGYDRVIVRTTVVERDYGRISVGQAADVMVDAYPDEHFSGKVARIAPMLQESSRVAKMEVEVANNSHILKPGMFTKVRVVLAENDNAQTVPSQAVVNLQGNPGIFVIDKAEPVAHFLPVKLGIATLDRTEILSPKIDGAVVTLGQNLLTEGSRVILPQKRSPGGRRGGVDSSSKEPAK
ncbi:MAG: efflux RND transporter periplasmic adaptor subunit [Candidatus Latescibacter sp.]|nr:efflux RND transporter periplasmic adaptor subunit [Candidatus Latescibacter sp.]